MNALSRLSVALLAAAPLSAQTAAAQTPPAAGPVAPDAAAALPPASLPPASLPPAPLPYARIADLVVAAPLTIDAVVTQASALKPAESPGLATGHVRIYAEATVTGLIRGAGGVAARIAYLADVPADARGRAPRLRRARVLLFARTVAGRPGEVQLIRPDAQLAWTPALDATVRAIAAEVVRPDAPPAITGIASAIHTPGNLVGEGETTIFLATTAGDPLSLTILRRPGLDPVWSIALGEVLTDTESAVRPDTLLWYRLACGLPATLPDDATATLAPTDATAAAEDYRFVRDRLGACAR